KLLLINSNSQHLDNEEQEVKNVVEQPVELGNQTRSGNTTQADNSLPEYDSFCFEIEPDQERLINVVKSNISDESSNDPLLEEADLFLVSDNSIPPGIENVADDSEGDICLLEELLINNFIPSHESCDSNFEDNPSIPLPPPEPPDAETDAGEEIPVVMNDKDKFDKDYYFFMFNKVFSFLSAKSEDTIFDPECLNCVYGNGKPLTCNKCGGMLRGGFCFPCNLEAENSFICDQSAYSFNNNSNYLPQPYEYEVTLEDKRECDVPISENSPICDNHSDIFSYSKIDDDISVYNYDFENIKYVEASLPDPEIVSVEEENVVQQEEEEVDLEDIFKIQDVVLRKKLLSITHLIANIEYLNDNSTPDHVLNSFESDNFLLDTFSPEFETFCDHTEETRSGNTTHADNSLPEYYSFCFEIEPDQERLINVVKSNIFDESSNDPLLEEADLFLVSDNSIPPGIENVADDSEGDIRFLEELLINNSIPSHESCDSNFEDNLSIPLPPPEPPDAETDAGEEIPVVMNDKDKFDKDYYFFMFNRCFLFSPLRVRILSLTLDLPPVIEVFLCWIFVPVSKILTSFD
nr:hypothetical protein [Tanacetum cinerariifolium]